MLPDFTVFQNNYVQNFPTLIPRKAAQGFIATAAIAIIVGGSFKIAMISGTLAATVTIIEAVTRPIIRSIFPEYPQFAKCIQIFFPKVIAFSLLQAVAPWLIVSYTVESIIVSLAGWYFFNYDFYENNVGMMTII